MKTQVDKLDVDKLKTISADLSNVVDNDIVKKTVYNKLVKLVTKINAIYTKVPSKSRLVCKIQNDLDKQGLKKKMGEARKEIHNIGRFVKKTDCNTKITETMHCHPQRTCFCKVN